MKYKAGDKVRIRGKEWYDKHKDANGEIRGAFFDKDRAKLCGTIQKITNAGFVCGSGVIIYSVEDAYEFIGEEAIEGLVEEEKIEFTEEDKYWCDIMSKSDPTTYVLPQGYQFVDENGNVINATKIVLEKKKKEYPKTYEECCYVLGFENTELVFEDDYRNINPSKEQWKRLGLINQFNKLLICRDAYWKLYGEEMGLGKPWEPDWYGGSLYLFYYNPQKDEFVKAHYSLGGSANSAFVFPTAEMRDAYMENFDPDIEKCKLLL